MDFRKFIRRTFIYNVLVVVPLALLTLIVGITSINKCNIISMAKFDLSAYLIVLSVVNLTISILLSLHYSYVLNVDVVTIDPNATIAWSISMAGIVLNMIWLCMGVFVIFADNHLCIIEGYFHAIYSIIIWILTIINIAINIGITRRTHLYYKYNLL